MKNSLLFSCGFQASTEWKVLYSRGEVTKERMLEALEYLKYDIGGARLEIIPEPNIGLSELSVQFDSEKYLLTAIEYDEEGEMLIRGPGSDVSEPVVFLSEGELYPSNAITNNFELVKKAFIEFLTTGDISYNLMEVVY